MWYSLLVGVGGVVGLMALWLAVQHWVRSQSADLSPDADVLEASAHNCHGCLNADGCDLIGEAMDGGPAESCMHPGKSASSADERGCSQIP